VFYGDLPFSGAVSSGLSLLDHPGDDAQVSHALGNHRAQVLFGRDGAVLAANARFFESTGYEEQDLATLEHARFCGLSVEAQALWEFVLEGATYAGEVQRVLAGRRVWIDALYVPIVDISGDVTKVLCSFVDVTERRLRTNADRARIEAMERELARHREVLARIAELAHDAPSSDEPRVPDSRTSRTRAA
jgi:PAS domain S-box-containing protein